MKSTHIPSPKTIEPQKLTSRISSGELEKNLTLSFSKFKIQPISIKNEFNNHFKDEQHFSKVMAAFLGTILPNITSYKYNDIREGGSQNKTIHFHTMDDKHMKLVYKVLEAYGYSRSKIIQMEEGGALFSFSASLGHNCPARVVCHKIDNVIYLLFFDTNHHIYFNEKYVKESLFYESCPNYLSEQCDYMPENCFAFQYLDESKIASSLGYKYNMNE